MQKYRVKITLPNFIIIGAAKCGTTSLCHHLNQHPQIFISPQKEPRFFAPEFYTKHTNGLICKNSRRESMSLEKYANLFAEIKDEKAIGEASTEYLFYPQVPPRIKSTISDVKLIVVLRDPSERAFSAYCYQLRDGCENLSFKQALLEEEKRKRNNWRPGWLYKQAGLYAEQILRYIAIFESYQLKICLHEQLESQPLETLQEIFDFLEVSSNFVPILSRMNVSTIPKNIMLNQLFSDRSPLVSLKPYIPDQIEFIFKSLKQKNLDSKPNLPPEIRQELIDFYRSDILKLQDLINHDLSSWMKQ